MDTNRKKELREAYKERELEMGVFFVTCTESGQTYFGATKNIPAGFNRAQFQLNSGMHPNKKLQEAWDRLGEEAFEFGVVQYLETVDSKDDYAEDLETLLDLCLTENPEAERLVPGRGVR